MTKDEYLYQLEKYLRRLPKSDYENAIEYFKEYFEDAGAENEQKVIEELGMPKEAAAELLSNLLKEKTTKSEFEKKEEKKSSGRILLITCLALFAAPLGTPVLAAALLLVFVSVLLILISVFIVAIFSISTIIGGIRLIVYGVTVIASSVPAACFLAGAGMMGIGIGVCLCILEIYLCKWVVFGIGRAGQRIIQRKERKKI